MLPLYKSGVQSSCGNRFFKQLCRQLAWQFPSKPLLVNLNLYRSWERVSYSHEMDTNNLFCRGNQLLKPES